MGLKGSLRAVDSRSSNHHKKRRLRRRERAARRPLFELQPLEKRLFLSVTNLREASYDFEGGTPYTTGWTHTSVASTVGTVTQYLVNPGTPGTNTLTLGSLPAHDSVTVSFDVYIFDKWSATAFSVTANGNTIVNTTFSNSWTGTGGSTNQTYPSNASSGLSFAPDTGAASSGTDLNSDGLDTLGGNIHDSVYHFTVPVRDSAGTLALVFTGGTTNATFGLDNVAVDLGASETATSGPDIAAGTAAVQIAGPNSGGFGYTYDAGVTWSNNTESAAAGGAAGNGTFVNNLPTLVQDGTATLAVIDSGTQMRWFDNVGGTWTERYGGHDALTYDSGNHQYVLVDTDGAGPFSPGTQVAFYDFTVAAGLQGKVKLITDPGGNPTTLTYDGNNNVIEAIRSSYDGTNTTKESFLYTYLSGSDANAGKLQSIVLRRKTYAGTTDTGNYASVRQSNFIYYQSGATNGNAGDLMTATLSIGGVAYVPTATLTTGGTLSTGTNYYYQITAILPQGETGPSPELYVATGSNTKVTLSWTAVAGATGYNVYRGTSSGGELLINSPGNVTTYIDSGASTTASMPPVLDTNYFRYYTSNTAPGYTGGLKYAFGPQAYARLAAALPAGTTPQTASDAQVAPYADTYFEYDSTTHAVTTRVQSGDGCPSCTGGLGTYTYAYTYSTGATGYNYWTTKVTETLPDLTVTTHYYNYLRQPILTVVQEPVSGALVGTLIVYDTVARVILRAQPSAVHIPSLATIEAYPDLLNNTGTYSTTPSYQYVYSGTGEVQTYTYTTGSTTATATSAGAVLGYLQSTQMQLGEGGSTTAMQESMDYYCVSGGGATVYPIADDTVYGCCGCADPRMTSYFYSFYSGSVQMSAESHSVPPPASGQHGLATGSATGLISGSTTSSLYDPFCRTMDPDGSFVGYLLVITDGAEAGETATVTGFTHSTDTLTFTNVATAPAPFSQYKLVPYTTSNQYDTYGQSTWATDGGGYLSYTSHDPATGAVTRAITDVQTADAGNGDFVNLPSGWVTPAGGGLELVTSMQVDDLGRTPMMTSPNGNVTYTVPNDANYEQDTFTGLQLLSGSTTASGSGGGTTLVASALANQAASSYVGYTVRITSGADAGLSETVSAYTPATGTLTFSSAFTSQVLSGVTFVLTGTTGPTQVSREYRPAANAASGQQTMYEETLTTSAALTVDANGYPTGLQTISAGNIQSLDRSILDNAGQVVEDDRYPTLSGVTYSTATAYLGAPLQSTVVTQVISDTATQGTWQGHGFGSDGYGIPKTGGDETSYPGSYATVTPTGVSEATWSTGGPSAKLVHDPSPASTQSTQYWYNATTFSIDVNMTAGTAHRVSLYFLDYDGVGFSERVSVTNVTTGELIDNRGVSNFSGGTYLSYILSGHVKFTFTSLNAFKAVLSGLFFDAASSAVYYPTFYGYDLAGRPDRVQNSNGTITRSVYNGLGQEVSQWTGTNDAPASGFWSPTTNASPSNMLDQQDNYYGTQMAPPKPGLNVGGTGTLSGTYYVKVTYVIGGVESAASVNENSLFVFGPHVFTVNAPPTVTGETGYNVYVSTSSGNEVLQNGGTPVGSSSTWTESTLVTGTATAPKSVGAFDLTETVQHPGSAGSDRVTLNYYDWMDRLVMTKSGVQASEDSTTHRPILYYTYDNLGEVIETRQYDGDTVDPGNAGMTAGVPNAPSSTLLRAQTVAKYDDQGNVYETLVYGVDPGEQSGHTAGTVSANALATDVFYDYRGNVIAQFDPGGLVTKYVYDGADRVTTEYQGDGGAIALTLSTAMTPANASTITNDQVLEQTTYTYDADGNVILSVLKQRDDSAGSTDGALGDPSTAPLARVYYEAYYYDAADRLTDDVNYGTNGSVAVTRPNTPVAKIPGTASAGTASTLTDATALTSATTGFYVGYLLTITSGTYAGQTATVTSYDATNHKIGFAAFAGTVGTPTYTLVSPALVTHTDYNVQGLPYQVTDPRGIVALTSFDLLGRVMQTIAGAFASGGLYGPTNSTNQTTNYLYDGNDNVVVMEALLSGGSIEDTAYIYGVGGTAGTNLFSNDLIAKVEYPDKTSGAASTSAANDQSFSYDKLGEETGFTDQNNTTHAYSFDVLGRLISDNISTLGSGVDGAVKYRTYSYETQGQLYQATTWTQLATGSVVTQDQYARDSWGRVVFNYQEHSGAVNTCTSAKVQYNYTEMASGVNNDRLTSMVYPNGRQLDYNYNTGIDTTVSRISALQDDGGTCSGTALESYKYLGLDTIVERDRQNGLNLTYISGSAGGDGGDQYQGLDRFGRVVAQKWVSGSTPKDSFQYGYDQGSNVLYKNNLLSASNSELYHSNASGAGDSSGTTNGYDAFNRLQNFRRGTLSASAYNYGSTDTVTNANLATSGGSVKAWSLDAQGNWTSTTTGTGNGTSIPPGPTMIGRSANRQNQITNVSGSTTPVYDNNGNMTTDELGHTYVYDAWNHLVKETVSGIVGTYAYDALGQSPAATTCSTSHGINIYYSTGWQDLEEDPFAGTTLLKAQYVWGLGYVDALVARDDNSTSGSYGMTGSGLGRRLFAQQDANYNVTSLSDTTGAVVERFIYDPYGSFQVLDSTWSSTSDAYTWKYLFQDLAYDSFSGLYNGRNRSYSPTLGRWMQEEPNGANFIDGMNLYQFVTSNPTDFVDSYGLAGEPAGAAAGPTSQPAGPIAQGATQINEFDTRDALNKAVDGHEIDGQTSITIDSIEYTTFQGPNKMCGVKISAIKWHVTINILSKKGFLDSYGAPKWDQYPNYQKLSNRDYYNGHKFPDYEAGRVHELQHAKQYEKAVNSLLTKYIEKFNSDPEKCKCNSMKEAKSFKEIVYDSTAATESHLIKNNAENEFDKLYPAQPGLGVGEDDAVNAERQYLDQQYQNHK